MTALAEKSSVAYISINRIIVAFFVIWTLALIILTAFYQDSSPFFILMFALIIGIPPTITFVDDKEQNLLVFLKIFATLLVIATVVQVYMHFIFDVPIQVVSDMNKFYHAALGDFGQFTLGVRQTMDSPYPVIVWQYVYNLATYLGVPRTPILGIILNSLIMSWSGVITWRLGKLFLDVKTCNILVWLFALSGFTWLFGVTFLRDCYALFLNVLFIYYSLIFIDSNPTKAMRIAALFGMAITFYLSLYTRAESILFLLMWGGLLTFFKGFNNLRFFVLVIAGTIIGGVLFMTVFNGMIYILYFATSIITRQEYVNAANDAQGLGTTLILSQPIPIRVTLGTILLHANPIPLWSGFDVSFGVYKWLKSFGGIYLALLVPSLLVGFVTSFRTDVADTQAKRNIIKANAIFCIIVAVVIAMTSMEQRHYAVYLPQLILLALIPNYKSKALLKTYSIVFSFWMLALFGVHTFWAYLKFL